MTNLNSLEQSSFLKVKQAIDEKLGKGQWAKFEPETVLMEFSAEPSDLLLDKINVLRVLALTKNKVYEDPALFLYVSEVANNFVADFDSIPYPTLLESAYSIHAIDQVLRDEDIQPEYSDGLKKAVTYLLLNEGCSEPIAPFTFINKDDLVSGQTPSDTKAKEQAIHAYLKYMDSL